MRRIDCTVINPRNDLAIVSAERISLSSSTICGFQGNLIQSYLITQSCEGLSARLSRMKISSFLSSRSFINHAVFVEYYVNDAAKIARARVCTCVDMMYRIRSRVAGIYPRAIRRTIIL